MCEPVMLEDYWFQLLFCGTKGPTPKKLSKQERIASRQRQIALGKNTTGYRRYRELVPVRLHGRKEHPVTPRAESNCSKRSWDSMYRQWRQRLHHYDETTLWDYIRDK